MKSYGNTLKRTRTTTHTSSSLVSSDPLELYRPSSSMAGSNGRTAWKQLQRSPSSSQSSSSPSPSPPSAYNSRNNSHHTIIRASSLPSDNSGHSYDDSMSDDPFAFTEPTQTIEEEEDEFTPTARAPVLTKAVSNGRSSSSIVHQSSFHLTGASRAKADDLQFLLDGLVPSSSLATRYQSAFDILRVVLKPPSSIGEADGMSLLRSVHGFERIIDAMPPIQDIRKPENEVFATLWICLAYLASDDLTNSSFMKSTGLDIIVAFAFNLPVTSDQENNDGGHTNQDAMIDISLPPNPLAPIPSRKPKSRRQSSTNVISAAELVQLVVEHERSLQRKAIETGESKSNEFDRAQQIHLDSVSHLSYLAFLVLTSFSQDGDLVHRLLTSSMLYPKATFLRAMLHQLRSCEETIRGSLMKISSSTQTRPTKGKRAASSSSSASAASSSNASEPSDELLRAHHRLVCMLLMLENCTHHSTGDFALLAKPFDDGDVSGTQLLFDLLQLLAPNIDHHQSGQAQPVPPALSPMLPSLDPRPLTPILILLRLLVNVTNRNDAGVEAINALYTTGIDGSSSNRVSGMHIVMDLVSRIRWSSLSGNPDMFNLLSIGVPIIVNSLEWSKKSIKLFNESCTTRLLAENAALSTAALESTPSTPHPASSLANGSSHAHIPALDWFSAFWTFLHNQLNELAAAAAAKDAERSKVERRTAQTNHSNEEQDDDPFAPITARGVPSATNANHLPDRMTEAEAQLAEQLEQANQAEEELVGLESQFQAGVLPTCVLLLISIVYWLFRLLVQSLGYRTLASITSLILGFVSCASNTDAKRILRQLQQPSFEPMVQYIQEFLLLQSDSQLLQQEGLETTFKTVEELKRLDSTLIDDDDSHVEDNDHPDESESPKKKQKIDHIQASFKSLEPIVRVTSTTSTGSPNEAAAKFDQLFGKR